MTVQMKQDNCGKQALRLIQHSFENLYLIEIDSRSCTEYDLERFIPISTQNYDEWLIALAREMYKGETADFFSQMELSHICKSLEIGSRYTVLFRLVKDQICYEYEFGIFYFDEAKKSLAITRKEMADDQPKPFETLSELAYAKNRFQFLVDHVVDNFIEIEVKTGNCRMLHGNNGMHSFSTLKEQVAWWAENLIAQEEREAYIAEFELEHLVQTLRANNGYHSTIYTTTQKDDCRSLSIVCRLFRQHHDNQDEYIFAYSIDVSQYKQQELRNKQLVDISQQLLTLSQTEPVTGLYNRTAAEKFITEHIENCSSEKSGTLLLFDIDHFKQFNDRYGHQAGDSILKFLSKSMQDIFRSDDILCRWGGDEFMVFMRDVSHKNTVESRIQRLRMRMQQCERNSTALNVTVSIGGAVAGKDATLKTLFAQCDSMLYRVKEQGRDGFLIYEDSGLQLEKNCAGPIEK